MGGKRGEAPSLLASDTVVHRVHPWRTLCQARAWRDRTGLSAALTYGEPQVAENSSQPNCFLWATVKA